MKQLVIVPIERDEAIAYVREHHRHHEPPKRYKFALAVARVADEKIVGVAIVGRPVARLFCDGWTVEVTRCCTDGTKNAPSALYRAATRAAFVRARIPARYHLHPQRRERRFNARSRLEIRRRATRTNVGYAESPSRR